MAATYYNEWDPFAAAWLRNLAAANQITPGRVDERSIADVRAEDLVGVTRGHFFAGIGGWDLALRLAGWPDDLPVWTGSCPCQPFSQAGQGKGADDERHLWPEWFRLIRECRPPVILGEQVASKPGLAWLDLVHADLEGAGYTVRAADICAAGVGAPHLRQRLWFVAYAERDGVGAGRLRRAHGRLQVESDRHGTVGGVADDDDEAGRLFVGREGLPGDRDAPRGHDADGRSEDGIVAYGASGGRGEGREASSGDGTGSSDDSVVGDADGCQRDSRMDGSAGLLEPVGASSRASGERTRSTGLMGDTECERDAHDGSGGAPPPPRGLQSKDRERQWLRAHAGQSDDALDPWADCEWIWCTDGNHGWYATVKSIDRDWVELVAFSEPPQSPHYTWWLASTLEWATR